MASSAMKIPASSALVTRSCNSASPGLTASPAPRSPSLPASAASFFPRLEFPRLLDGTSAAGSSSRRHCRLAVRAAKGGARSSGSGKHAAKERGATTRAAAAGAGGGGPGAGAVAASAAASAATATETESTDDSAGEARPLLGCPVCFQPLSISGSGSAKTFNMNTASRMRLQCATCARAYATGSAGYADLTLTAGVTEYVEPPLPFRSEAFKSPVFSFVYERGYRQNFTRSGFPGPDEEFRMAEQWLDSHEGGRVVDLSCGSGLFTRRFAASGGWASVIAADLSGAMLEQTAAYIKEDKSLKDAQERIMLIQADVSRLPFCSGSIDAVHAGAAMHCWPSPSLAMAEINRVLRPGGKFVASTILWPSSPFGNDLIKSIRKPMMQSLGMDTTMKLWEGEELRELLTLSGFVEYRQESNGQFIMVFGQKAE